MTETDGDSAEEPHHDGDGLFASAPNSLATTIRGKITAFWWGEVALRERKMVLTELERRDRMMKEAHDSRGSKVKWEIWLEGYRNC